MNTNPNGLKMKLKRNDGTLASKIVKYPNHLPLTSHVAPTYSEEEAEIETGKRSVNLDKYGSSVAGGGILKRANAGCIISDNLAFVQQLNTATLTNKEAEQLSYPYCVPAYAIDTLAEAAIKRLKLTRKNIKWAQMPDLKQIFPKLNNSVNYVPKSTHDDATNDTCKWNDDLRFIGEWWICLESTESKVYQDTTDAIGVKETYKPLFVPSASSPTAMSRKIDEERLIFDLIKRLVYGKRYFLELLHVDNILFSAERFHAFFFNGLLTLLEEELSNFETTFDVANEHLNAVIENHRTVEYLFSALDDRRRNDKLREDSILMLSTLSFSICQMSTSSLFILLLSLTTRPGHCICNLDLSFNLLDANSFYTLGQLLPLTRIRKLSLRGNNFKCENTTSFREFLVDVCNAPQVGEGRYSDNSAVGGLNELDLGGTQLSYKQICVVIESLPLLRELHYLSLECLDIPFEKTTALAKAVERSNLFHLSLEGVVSVAGNDIYLSDIQALCDANRRRCLGDIDRNDRGMFHKMFERGLEKGWKPPAYSALPEGYRPYSNNDPSLWLDD